LITAASAERARCLLPAHPAAPAGSAVREARDADRAASRAASSSRRARRPRTWTRTGRPAAGCALRLPLRDVDKGDAGALASTEKLRLANSL